MAYYYSNNNPQYDNNRENQNVIYMIPQEHPNYNEYYNRERESEETQNYTKEKPAKEYNELGILFSEKSIRRAFARKVFSIVLLLILKTTAICAICMYFEPVRQFWSDPKNSLFIMAPIPVYITTVIFVLCVPGATKIPPWNYINLFLFSSSISIMVGAICSKTEAPELVLMAFGATVLMVFCLTIFSIQTHIDFTGWRMFFFTLVVHLILMAILCFSFWSIATQVALGVAGIFLFSLYLIIDIQLIVGGNRSYNISPEDYILAVIVIYLDILILFLYILRCIRFSK